MTTNYLSPQDPTAVLEFDIGPDARRYADRYVYTQAIFRIKYDLNEDENGEPDCYCEGTPSSCSEGAWRFFLSDLSGKEIADQFVKTGSIYRTKQDLENARQYGFVS